MDPERETSRRPQARVRGGAGGAAAGAKKTPGRRSAAERSKSLPSGRSEKVKDEAAYRDRVKQAMTRLLSVRMRSRRELELRLLQRRFRIETIKDALDDFERVGLVDDRKFARLFLESRLRRRPRSYNVLVRELRAKGIADELVKEVVDECRHEVTEEELARRALKGRLKSAKSAPSEQARARAARFLAGRGFAPSLIVEVIQDL